MDKEGREGVKSTKIVQISSMDHLNCTILGFPLLGVAIICCLSHPEVGIII